MENKKGNTSTGKKKYEKPRITAEIPFTTGMTTDAPPNPSGCCI